MRLALPLLFVVATVSAQEAPLAFPPSDARVRVTADLVDGGAATGPLRMDVYRMSGAGASPVMLFFVRASGPERHQPVYDAWARAAAGRGLVAMRRLRHAARQRPRLSRSRPAGGGGVPEEGGRHSGGGVAAIDPGAVRPGVAAGRPGVCGAA